MIARIGVTAAFVAALVAMCMGVSCTISVPGDDDDGTAPGYVQLDRAAAEVSVSATVPGPDASVAASIRRALATVELKNGQEVSINGVPLIGPGTGGLYTRTVPRTGAYVIRVVEPTLGANETAMRTPADFAITSPAAGASVSLAGGFELGWSEPNPDVTYTVTLSQALGNPQVQVLGPFADDSGSRTVTAADLMKFRQGAEVTIKLTKTARTDAIGGFATGTARVELSQTIGVVPAP